ncbi:phosphoribosyl-ATP diphosphatase [Candidatus Bathyarchaeota archaeon]|nr:MAG: phosphoribosyl-ATP diphosphatase [Candidatus Hecatellales archaeon]RLI34334.1 MAG: phosphoribosyl-ATP diphosphatase [Candidatus Bathyarchaeota archaeon]
MVGCEILLEVFRVVEDRRDNPKPESYVSGLMAKGLNAILEKISEEAGELVEAAEVKPDSEVVHEAADLLFHMMVLLAYRRIKLEAVFEELAGRRKPR